MERYGIIMAGGSGTRFWPVSRQRRPKQLLRLSRADKTMLQEAVDRIAPLIPPENVYVATALHLVDPIRAARTGIPDANVIGEPCKRNTAGCLAFAAAHLLARTGGDGADAAMAVLTADHLIGEAAVFRDDVTTALETAESGEALVTIGIPPSRPEAGYGHIEVPEAPPAGGVAAVLRFHEKPDRATAEQYTASGRFFWNSGMFFWRVSAFLGELDGATPAHSNAARAIAKALQAGDSNAVQSTFEALEDISIDYALMEKGKNVRMVRARFPWDDVGAWDALERALPRDGKGNVSVGDPILIDARDNIVYNEPGAADMAVAVIGVEGLVVVASPDGVLVVPKGRAQDVKKAVEALKAGGGRHL
jgi:mannose-1-phosphate guanylyltransferase